ncbi:MAG: TatD family hydrolase [Zoogloeaceae bacterium]|jgi:TatD DNase family protein|nr:TatD family hydrolase [Zoogloeaceae bacterium]
MSSPFLIDSHCHLYFPELAGQLPEILEAMRQNDVQGAVCVGVSLKMVDGILKLVEAHPRLFASVGLHPSHEEPEEPDEAAILNLCNHPKVIAIGETGLDYHWQKDKPEWQRKRFRVHIRAALQAKKPLIIHSREAAADTLAILREEGAQAAGGIFHCFSGDMRFAEEALALGFYISFSGVVTFKNAKTLQEVAANVPLDRILVETDAPYLAPVPHRGQTNQPAYVRHVAETLATLRQTSLAAIMDATSENFFRLFPQTQAAFA